MAKSQALELIWEIVDVLPAGKYKVKLADMDFVITWYKSWNMKRNNIVIMLWDYVKIEINEYDNTQWRITYRYKYPPAEVTGEATKTASASWGDQSSPKPAQGTTSQKNPPRRPAPKRRTSAPKRRTTR